MRIFPIGDILKSMREIDIRRNLTRGNPRVSFTVLNRVPDSKSTQDDHDQTEASQKDRKSHVVPWRVLVTKHLWTDGVSRGPEDEIRGDDNWFLGLARYISRQKGQWQGWNSEKWVKNPIGDEHANLLIGGKRNTNKNRRAEYRWDHRWNHDNNCVAVKAIETSWYYHC